ncbi:galactose mutarotase-like protein [Ceraceosorus bombacis]|uniref:Galactose mutarotase-like protein n=1 Tax=Ceraceosorus bombacis TaxID=401625 RepID=A0A0P1BBX2_9BASI|nr:galactose mutarotase-like protein [Ceraceosorus bombacis]
MDAQVANTTYAGYSGPAGQYTYGTCPDGKAPQYPANVVRISAEDDSIRAGFIPYGATLVELWVRDRDGAWRDVVLSFDNTTNYLTDPIHPNFGPTVGRYANRIKNGTFTANNQTYYVPRNENGKNSLHGGDVGYDRSPFVVESFNATSIVFAHVDPDGFQGFPGQVDSRVIHTLQPNATWAISMSANVSAPQDIQTPILLSSHVYWNLDAYADGSNSTILDHVLHMPHADKYIQTDSDLIPTGPRPDVSGTPFDFLQPTPFRRNFDNSTGICGANCTGWDSCFWQSNEPARDEPQLEMYSPRSGIKLSLTTDQPAFQIYTCSGISSPAKGSLPRKRSHGGDGTLAEIYENHSCVVIEAEGLIDAINNPDWNVDQLYSASKPYTWAAEYRFSNVDEQGQPVAASSAATATATATSASVASPSIANATSTSSATNTPARRDTNGM